MAARVCSSRRKGLKERILRGQYPSMQDLEFRTDRSLGLDRCDEGRAQPEWTSLVLEAIKVGMGDGQMFVRLGSIGALCVLACL